MWKSWGVLFLAFKMSQDPVDDVLILNASDDPDRASTASTDLDVDIEYSLESLGHYRHAIRIPSAAHDYENAALSLVYRNRNLEFNLLWQKRACCLIEI